NYGVNKSGVNLSGFGWSNTTGWIKFNPTHGGVTIDAATGAFDGYAWGENIGWIHFKGNAPAYSVKIAAPPPPPDPPPPYIPPIIIDPPIITPPIINTDTQVVTSGTVTNSGIYEDVTVGAGATVTNSGTLTDLNNSGEVSGGVVSGDSVNNGVMDDVVLPPETTLDNAGGTLSNADNAGEVFGGTIQGKVTNTGVISGTTTDGVIDTSYAVTIQSGATVSGGQVAGAIVNNGVLDNVTIGNNAVVSFGASGQLTGTITIIDNEGGACVIAIPSNVSYPNPQSITQDFVLTPQLIIIYAKQHSWNVKIEEKQSRLKSGVQNAGLQRSGLERNSFAASSTLPQVPESCYLIGGVVFSETGSKSSAPIDMAIPFDPKNVPDIIDASDMIVMIYNHENRKWETVSHTLQGNSAKIKSNFISAVAIVAEGIFTVTYDGNSSTGGSVPASQFKTHDVNLTLSKNIGNLVKTGYKFAGWNTSADGSGTNYAEEILYSTNVSVTFYAKWIVEEPLDRLVAAVKDADKTIKDAQIPNPASPSSPPEEEDVVEAIDKVVYALDMATGMIKNDSVTPSGALIVLPVAGDVLKLMGESSGNDTGVNKEKVVYILQKSSAIMSQALEGELTSETQNSIVNGADGILGAMPSIIASMDKEDGFAVVEEMADIIFSGIQAGLSATEIDSTRLTGFVDNISDIFTALPLDTTITGNTNIVKNAAGIIAKAVNALTHSNADNTNKNARLVIGQLQKEVASIIDAIHANMLKNPVPFSDLTQVESVQREGATESDLISPEKVENLTQEIARILKPFIYRGCPLDKVLMNSTISVVNGAFSAIFDKLGSNRGVELNSSELTNGDVLKALFVDNPLLLEDILDITGVDVSIKNSPIASLVEILKAESSLIEKNTSAILSALPQLFNLESVVVEEESLKATDVVKRSLEHIFEDSNISYISPFPGIMEITIKWNENMGSTLDTYPVMVSGINAVAATLPEGIYILPDTRLVMVSDNLAVTLLPIFGNLLTLVNDIIEMGLGFKILDDGRWSADSGSKSPMIFGMTGYGKAILSESDANKIADAGNTTSVDFILTGDNPSSRDYCLEVVYNEKEIQVMPPALHTSALNHITNLLESVNLKYNINLSFRKIVCVNLSIMA
ncbi:MAG: InlB B-repeat-containing protein, partial [Desulfamplus sp.]|nr:InlB B-repeat-containing protein [Desulfamplus sp.]